MVLNFAGEPFTKNFPSAYSMSSAEA